MESTATLRGLKLYSNTATDVPLLDSPSLFLLIEHELLAHKLEKLQYKPLPNNGEHIRILELHPGAQEDVLSCDLKLINLTVRADYEPLSYVWGDGHEIPIKCSGSYISVKPNLFNALWVLRHPTRTLRLWADAICINQKDFDERAAQVRIMQKVYASPPLVHVWLGLDKEGMADKGFQFIKRLIAVAEPHLQQVYAGTSMPHNVENAFVSMLADGLSEPDLYGMLVFLFYDNPWIQRVWIQQEIGSARDANMHWGHGVMRWTDVLRFACIMFTLSSKEVRPLQRILVHPMGTAMVNMWRGFALPGAIHPTLKVPMANNRGAHMAIEFINVMECSRYLLATVEHDYVYAFLGHSSCYNFLNSIWDPVPIDYTAPPAELYTKLAEHLLYKTGSLIMLSFIAAERTNEKSWVPRWSEPRNMSLVQAYDADLGTYRDASRLKGSYTDPERVDRNFHVSAGVLIAEGIAVDTITHMHGFVDYGTQQYNRRTKVQMDSVWRSVRAANPGVPSTRLWQSFAWCLVAGIIGEDTENEKNSRQLRSDLSCFMQSRCKLDPGELDELTMQDPKLDAPAEIEAGGLRFLDVANKAQGEGIGSTSTGLLGSMPPGTRPGDVCCVLIGAAVPSVLRETEDKRFRLIGDCYLHGFMQGEAIDKWEKGELSKRTFEIT